MPDEATRERARDEFVVVYVSDRDLGRLRTEEEYRRLFPGHEDLVSAEWRRLEDHFSRQPSGVGHDSGKGLERPARTRMFGRYRIERELGRGGQGTVYLAQDAQVGRHVALKILKIASTRSSSIVSRFEREARALARLDHPGIAAVHDVGSAHGLEYFAMRYVEGQTLASELAGRGPAVPDDRAVARYVAIVEKCARALHAAHEAGLVHRDVKPENIMLRPEGEPVVLDFGVAGFADSAASKLTDTGDILGTPAFMAPEQIAGDVSRVDRRTDVYALAMVLRALVGGGRAGNRAVSRNLDAVLQVACASDPDGRYATAAAFADDLDRVRKGLPVLVRPPGALRRLAIWCRRAPAAAAVVFLPPLALLGGLIALSFKNDEIRAAARALEVREAEAATAAQEAVARFTDFRRLEDLRLVQDLEARERELWPPHPAIADALERWLKAADALLSGLPSHRTALESLRRTGRPAAARETGSDPVIDRLTRCEQVRNAAHAELGGMPKEHTRRSALEQIAASAATEIAELETVASSRPAWRFDRVEDQWLHENLAHLVGRLERLEAGPDPGCSITSVRRRLAVARELGQRSLVEHAEAWRNAVAAIANPQTDPAYGGLRIEPVIGLVPLGRDPKSRLWEFGHLLSGDVPARHGDGRIVLTERSSIVLVLIPGGRVRMGARPTVEEDERPRDHVDPAAAPHEAPVHDVTLDPFFISKYEMTQAQWLRATGSNPSYGSPDRFFDDEPKATLLHPAEQVSFLDCVAALERYGLEVPTEAQWEHAVRGGTTTPWWPGETIESFLTTENLADSVFKQRLGQKGYAHDAERNDGWSNPAPVGSYPANPFGLHDAIGNVAEWCRDRIEFYRTPALPGDGLRAGGLLDLRATRGGAWNTPARLARSSQRRGIPDKSGMGWLGVRPALRLVRP